MIARTLLSVMCALAGTTYASGLEGARASIDIAVLDQAKDVYWSKLMTILNNLDIPDVDIDSENYFHDNELYIQQASNNVIFSTNPSNNEIRLQVNNLKATYLCHDFRAQSWIFVAYGHIEVDIYDMDISFGLSFDTQTLPDGTIMPYVKAVDTSVHIDRNDINISIGGSFWSDCAKVITPFIKGPVIDAIEDAANSALYAIPGVVNSGLAASGGHASMFQFTNWWLDFQTKEAAVVTSESFGFGIQGIMYDADIGEDEWSIAFADEMPYKTDAHTAGLQTWFSDQSIDSLIGSFIEIYDCSGWVNSTSTINGTALNTTAADVAVIFPQIAETYGDDTPVNVLITLTSAGDFMTSSETQMIGATATIDIQFWVETGLGDELALDVSIDPFQLNLTFTITDFVVSL
jgi:hypothetical protein